MLVQQLRARVHGPRRRHRHAEPLAQLDDRADDRLELHRPAGLESCSIDVLCAPTFSAPAMR